MQPEQYELLIEGKTYLLTFNPASVAPDRATDVGTAHMVQPGTPGGETVIGDYPYTRKSFVRNPFFMIKPV
jgi:hypothetical protein